MPAAASPAPTAFVASATEAADLRVALNNLLSEHVVLAASATGASLAGRMPQFGAVATSLDENAVDLAKAVGSVYGAQAAGNQPKVYGELRASMAQMQMVADPLAEATVKTFSEKFST